MNCPASIHRSRCHRWLPGGLRAEVGLLALAGLALSQFVPAPARALTPESPEVQQLVARAVAFFEKPLPPGHMYKQFNTPPGAKALIGLCMLKYYKGKDPNDGKNHPRVLEAVAAIQNSIPEGTGNPVRMDVYSTGVSLIFFFELDPLQYREEMQRLTDHLLALQKPNGGWGYPPEHKDGKTGDTSQTQYGVLGLWAAEQSGIATPLSTWERATNWLMRTQDPSGAHGYQGNDPGSFELVRQTQTRLSLSAAGLSTLYICADHLRANNAREGLDQLPGKLKPVGDSDAVKRRHTVDEGRLAQAQARGDKYLQANFTLKPDQWAHYYMYALERYYSFRDTAPGNQPSGNWYDEGFKVLSETQNQDGSWESPPESHIVADTAFGILFLLRSTQTGIQRANTFGSGTLAGGRGLPAGDSIQMRLGSVVAKPLSGPAEDTLLKMKDPDGPEFQSALAALEELTAEGQREILSQNAQRLRELAGGDSPAARAAALRALARTRNLDEVPLLIEALDDPDAEVFRAAFDGLRFISRKFIGGSAPRQPDQAERIRAVDHWESWYRSIRPVADPQE